MVGELELVLVDNRRQRVGAGIADLKRVAVGRRLDHFLDGEDSEHARLVLDHEAVAGHLPHLLADDADRDVGRAARAERHHHPDRLRRILVLRLRKAADANDESNEQR